MIPVHALENILHQVDCLRTDWKPGRWYAVGSRSLRRLVAYANSAFALRSYLAGKDMDVPRSSMHIFVGDSERKLLPNTIELDLTGLTFRIYLIPGCTVIETPGTVLVPPTYRQLTPADVVRAEWSYNKPAPRPTAPRKWRPAR